MTQPNASFFSNIPEREKREILLPSGRRITVLETTGKEEKILNKILQDNTKIPETMAQFLSGVTESLDGVDGAPSREAIDNLLVGDRMAILINCRILTHGAGINHNHTCGNCGSSGEYEIDLQHILDSMKPYPEGDKREFSIKIGNGVLYFELPNGKSEAKIHRQKESDYNAKLRSIRLWEESPVGALPVNLDNLKSSQIAELRSAVREKECVLDTMVTMTCQNCGRSEKSDVLGIASFLFPNLT